MMDERIKKSVVRHGVVVVVLMIAVVVCRLSCSSQQQRRRGTHSTDERPVEVEGGEC